MYEAFKDHRYVSEWRVETTQECNDDVIDVAIFSGQNANDRAKEYAEWKNSQALLPEPILKERI